MRRSWSKWSINGFHLVSITGEDGGCLGFFEKLGEKDEFGYMVGENVPECPHPGVYRIGVPWPKEVYLLVRSECQKCSWLVRTPGGNFDCGLIVAKLDARIQRVHFLNAKD